MNNGRIEVRDVTPANYFEGPIMVKRGGCYFLMYSNGITIKDTYQVHYAVGDNPLGPYHRSAATVRQELFTKLAVGWIRSRSLMLLQVIKAQAPDHIHHAGRASAGKYVACQLTKHLLA